MTERALLHDGSIPTGLDDTSPLERRGALGSRAHIRRTLGRADGSLGFRAQMRASVTAYVRRLHGDGVPPQRMLVLVKSAVREATPSAFDAAEARELMSAVVRWSIDAYYAA